MSTVPYRLFIPAKLTKFAFGLCFYVLVLFTPLLKQLILLAKQALVCKMLTITPPPFTTKHCFVWEVVTFIEGVPSKKDE